MSKQLTEFHLTSVNRIPLNMCSQNMVTKGLSELQDKCTSYCPWIDVKPTNYLCLRYPGKKFHEIEYKYVSWYCIDAHAGLLE